MALRMGQEVDLGGARAALNAGRLTLWSASRMQRIELSEDETERLTNLLGTSWIPTTPIPCPECQQPFVHEAECEARCVACQLPLTGPVLYAFDWLIHDSAGCKVGAGYAHQRRCGLEPVEVA